MPTDHTLTDVQDLQSIKGISFSSDVTFRQLIVTGPPGTGKTTFVTAIGGWPEEGYLDLTKLRWWRSRVLAVRPRQVHLGFPFAGHVKAFSMFEPEWLNATVPPELDLGRIFIPPHGTRRNPWKWRRKYVFEFLLPPAEDVLAARQQRSARKSHLIDVELSLDQVRRQLEVYWTVALHFHQQGIPTFVRDTFGGGPKTFVEPVRLEEIQRPSAGFGSPRKRQPALHSFIKKIISPGGYRILDTFDRVTLAGTKAKLAVRKLPIEIVLGPQALHVFAESTLQAEPTGRSVSIRVFDPDAYRTGMGGFLILEPGDALRIGKGDRDRIVTPNLPEDILPRLELGNEGDWVAISDLDSPTGTTVISLRKPNEGQRLLQDRRNRLERIRRKVGGAFQPLSLEQAIATLEAAIAIMQRDPTRPKNSAGLPGGLLELPDDTVPLIVGDLHANLDNLLNILSQNRSLDAIERGDVALILLGDLVHPEDENHLAEMDSSLLMMDIVLQLMVCYPGRIIVIRGNHDSFSPEIRKDGIPQGELWRETLQAARGTPFVELMQRFYDLLPLVAVGTGFIACHAGPPVARVSRKKLIELYKHPTLQHQLTWNRVQSARNPGGYTKRDVRALQQALGQKKSSCVIVSHSPRDHEPPAVWNHGGIKRHHLVYSARRDRVAVITRVGKDMVPLEYEAEHLLGPMQRAHI